MKPQSVLQALQPARDGEMPDAIKNILPKCFVVGYLMRLAY